MSRLSDLEQLYQNENTNGTLSDAFRLDPAKLDPLVYGYNCSFWFCLQALGATTTNGETNEHQLQTWDSMYQVQTELSQPLNPNQFLNEMYSFKDVPKSMGVTNASAYQVDSLSLNELTTSFGAAIAGGASLVLESAALIYQNGGQTSTDQSFFQTAQAFVNASDTVHTISALCDQISSGLTNYMRKTMPASSDRATYLPTVFSNEIFIHVRWAWLTFPISLVLAGYVFLIGTIWQTRRLEVKPWKGHRIPLLLMDLDEDVKRMASGGLESRNGLEERVGRMKVRLEYDDGEGIRFRHVV